jgi:di-trans,poly-cis-decaprenylcistransferase
LVESIEKEREKFIKNNVRLLAIGDLMRLPEDVRIKLQNCIADTSKHTGLTLVLALSYSSRWEITNAVKNIVSDIEKGIISMENIDESLISKYLTTSNIPDPDIVIRTGGDIRISNFLLWQAAYSEFFFTTKYWPEFSKEDYYDIIYQFQHRERRFGKTSEQIKSVTKQ